MRVILTSGRVLRGILLIAAICPDFFGEIGRSDEVISRPGANSVLAGVARVDITHRDALKINDPLYVKALVIQKGSKKGVLVTVDAVAIGEIGYINNQFLGKLRSRLQKEMGIPPDSVIVNASHCHGVVCPDVEEKTVQAVKLAVAGLVPVKIGVGSGFENRIMENRRLRLKSGKEADVRHAYSMPPDEEVAGIGPVDPQIGILRLDRLDGRTLAVVYNFACHPIMGVPSGANTADIVGFSSRVIEENLGGGALALFVQGCGGDINPVQYKEVDQPRSAEPLGTQLGLSVLKGVRQIKCADDSRIQFQREIILLPRAELAPTIDLLLGEQEKLLKSLQGTSLNLKTFVPLAIKYNLSPEFPSYYSHRYMREKELSKDDLKKHDEFNRGNIKSYMDNIIIMEKLTRLQTNLALVRKHNETNLAAGRKPLEAEIMGLRVGEFVLITFPGELTVEIGLNVKKASPHKNTFVAGYTNGYIYYTPTAKQLQNRGGAQEDSDCLLAPEWQKQFEDKVLQMLNGL